MIKSNDKQNEESSYVCLRCGCSCSMLIIDKYESTINREDKTIYNVSVVDSRYDHDDSRIWNRIKNAFKILFGKRIYYNDLMIGEEKFKKFVSDCNDLIQEESS